MLLITFLPFPVHGIDYFVKTNGNNGATGLSWPEAWRSINHAASNANGGDSVIVSNGYYHEQVMFSNSGTAISPIILKAYENHQALLIGTNLNSCIYVNDRSNIRIEGFRIRQATYAGIILCGSSAQNTITNNIINSNYLAGICLKGKGSRENRILNNSIHGPAQIRGICVTNSDRNTIRSNALSYHDDHGICFVNAALSNVIASNRIFYNYDNGIVFQGEDIEYNQIRGNVIYGKTGAYCSYRGIYFINCDHNVIGEGNVITNCMNEGIRFEGTSQSNIIVRNKIYNNYANGIWFNGEDDDFNIIEGNIIYGEPGAYFDQNYGLFIQGGDNNIISGSNVIYRSPYYGVYLRNNTVNNVLSNNIIYSNNEYGIYVDDNSSDRFTGNSIGHNVNGGIAIYASGGNNLRGNDIHGPRQNRGLISYCHSLVISES
ncbi:MAG: right-handed parallel beta-helix repeat-containing protein, partial [bacterium]|nr:right-handed parallel beta-helix repeat-containing protein [bacterium]